MGKKIIEELILMGLNYLMIIYSFIFWIWAVNNTVNISFDLGDVSFAITFICSCAIIAFVEFTNKKVVSMNGFLLMSIMTILSNSMLFYNYYVSYTLEEGDLRRNRLIMCFVVPIKPLLDVIFLFLIRRKHS